MSYGRAIEMRKVDLQLQVQREVRQAAGSPERKELNAHEVRVSSFVRKGIGPTHPGN